GHDTHAGDNVGAVGDFNADFTVGRIHRAKNVGHDVQGSALHSAVEERAVFVLGFGGSHPIISRASVFFFVGTDIRNAFSASDIVGIAAMEVRVRVRFLIQLDISAVGKHFRGEPLYFGRGAVDPHDLRGLRKA